VPAINARSGSEAGSAILSIDAAISRATSSTMASNTARLSLKW